MRTNASVSQTFSVGVNPSNVAITPDGKRGYVTNSNNYGTTGINGKPLYTLTVLDLQTGLPLLTIHDPSFIEPYRVSIDHQGKHAYVCNSGTPVAAAAAASSSPTSVPGQVVRGATSATLVAAVAAPPTPASVPTPPTTPSATKPLTPTPSAGTVSVIDIATNTVSKVISGFDGPSGIALSPSRAYVINFGAPGGVGDYHGHTVSVVDLKRSKITHTIDIPRAPQGIAISRDFRRVYVVSYVDGKPGHGKLSVISTKTNRVVARIGGFFGPFSVAASPNNRHVYVTNFGSNDFAPFGTTLAIVDVQKRRIIKRVPLGIQPSGVAVSPSGEFVYASTYNVLYAKPKDFVNLTPGESLVHIIRARDGQVIAPTISVGQSAATITLSPDGKKLYACKYTQNAVVAVCLE